jgi:hypothetical protein
MRMIKSLLRKGSMLAAAVVCALLIPLATANAALVNLNYAFTGNLNPTFDPLGMIPITGTLQLTDAPSAVVSTGGVHNGAVTGFSINIGGLYTATFASGANAVTISQNIPLGSGIGDRWGLVSEATGSNLNGFTPFRFDLRLDRIGGGILSDTSLQDPPSFTALNNPQNITGRWRLFFEDVEGNPAVYLGSISSLTAVPLPAAVLLFGAGLISLVGLGAGGLRNIHGSKT